MCTLEIGLETLSRDRYYDDFEYNIYELFLSISRRRRRRLNRATDPAGLAESLYDCFMIRFFSPLLLSFLFFFFAYSRSLRRHGQRTSDTVSDDDDDIKARACYFDLHSVLFRT